MRKNIEKFHGEYYDYKPIVAIRLSTKLTGGELNIGEYMKPKLTDPLARFGAKCAELKVTREAMMLIFYTTTEEALAAMDDDALTAFVTKAKEEAEKFISTQQKGTTAK